MLTARVECSAPHLSPSQQIPSTRSRPERRGEEGPATADRRRVRHPPDDRPSPRTDKTAATTRTPRFAPLTAEALHELATLSSTVISPALLTEDPGPLAHAAWAVSAALERMADLLALDTGESTGANLQVPWKRGDLTQDLAARLRTALHHAHAVAADGVSRNQLAARTLGSLMDLCDDGQAMPSDAPAGWTRLHSDRPSPELSGAQHLAIQDALEVPARTDHRRRPQCFTAVIG